MVIAVMRFYFLYFQEVSAYDLMSPLFYKTKQKAVLYGSIGSYLAQTIARRFDIDGELSGH